MENTNTNYPASPLGNNNILMDLANDVAIYSENVKNEISESPTFTYSSELLNEAIENTNKKIPDKSLNLVEDFKAIFPLSVTIVFLLMILILVYIAFF
tara:strand:- start:112 stop:405 length:294 start_codon:yes stop_codon:yes gene_type:complete